MSKSSHNQRPLFDVQDTYSYTLFEKPSTSEGASAKYGTSQSTELSMPISNELAPVTDQGTLLPASTVSMPLLSGSAESTSDRRTSGQVAEVVGFGSKTDKRDALFADVNFNEAVPVKSNAMGLMSATEVETKPVVVEKEAKSESASVLAPLLNLLKSSTTEKEMKSTEVKVEKLSEVKMEELKKTVVEAVQEEAKRPLHQALPEKEKVVGKAEQLAEASALKVEAKIEAKPEILYVSQKP